MKSQSILDIPLMGTIAIIIIPLSIILPPTIIKMTLDKEIVYTFEYEKTQYTLLALLSSTYNGNHLYEIIANNIDNPENLEFLKDDINKLVESKCYTIQVGDGNEFAPIVESGSCNKKYTFTTIITLPYSPDSKSRVKLLRIDVG